LVIGKNCGVKVLKIFRNASRWLVRIVLSIKVSTRISELIPVILN
jgi:hypothetical protein